MDSMDIRKLRRYLTTVLEPMMAADAEAIDKWMMIAESTCADRLNIDHAHKMKAYHEGRVKAFTFAIVEFKELFEEELKEGD